MAKLLCKLFGHRRFAGWYGDGLYGRVKLGPIDNLGEAHFTVTEQCNRCGEAYILARFHGSAVLRQLEELRDRGLYDHAIFTELQA